MTSLRSDRVVSVADLVGRPGVSRTLSMTVEPPKDLEQPVLRMDAPVQIEGVLESVVDGILFRGTATTTIQTNCSRCLADLEMVMEAEVIELFRDPAEVDPDDELEAGYEIQDTQIDLDVMVRDALAPALPYSPVCDEDCRGLCPTCGINRNEGSCTCTDITTDDRWAALEALRLPSDSSDDAEDVERGPAN